MTAAAQPSFVPVASAGEAESVIAHLIEVMKVMRGVVEQETSLVYAGKLAAAAQLIPTKTELSRLYLADTQRLKAGEEFLAQSSTGIRAALRTHHERFQAALQKNLTVLATAHAVSEGIMRGVSEELARKAMPSTYGASGKTASPKPRHGPALTVSRML